ncbi:MAG: 3-deoxy-manno-octulosonate cytidylyltransferase [Fidelibacterota bacterium]
MTQVSDGKVLGVIPARYRSRRFPGKVLALLDGIPVVARVYSQARKSTRLDSLVVATDSSRVRDALTALDIPVTLTSPAHRSGTERVAEVAGRSEGVGFVVNIQGDEPLIDPGLIDQVVEPLMDDRGTRMATVATRRFREGDWKDPQVVKVRMDSQGFATDFFREAAGNSVPGDCLKHIGLYAYSKEFLMELVGNDPTISERGRDLEQMRALDRGTPIKVVSTDYDALGVNTPGDLERIRERMGID